MQANSPEPDFDTSPQAENGVNHSNPGTHGYRTFDEYIDDRMKDYYEDDVLFGEQMDYYDYNEQPMDEDYLDEDPQLQDDPNIPTTSNAHYSEVDGVHCDSEVMAPGSTKGIQCLWANGSNQICGLAFETPTELTNHILKEHKMEKDDFVCCWSGCRRKLTPIVRKDHALIHLSKHTGESVYKCQTCNVEFFGSWKSLDVQAGRPLKCSKCEKETVNKILKEQLGQEALSSVPGLTDHQKPISHDQELCRNEQSGQAKPPEHFSQEGPSGMLLALNQGIGSEEHQCLWVTDNEVCLKSFHKPTDLRDHIRKVHLKRYRSGICLWRGCDRNRKPLNRKSNLHRHLRVHISGMPYTCKVCKEAFVHNLLLAKHMETHKEVTGSKEKVVLPKESTCLWVTDDQVCMQKCQTTEIMKHIRLFHTKESERFECCWQGCEHKKPLESHRGGIIHLRAHVGLRSYRCDTCHREYSNSGTLSKHKNKGRGCPGLAQSKEPPTKVFRSPVEYRNLSHQDLGTHYEDPGLEDQETDYNEQQLPLEEQTVNDSRKALMELEHQQAPHYEHHFLEASSAPLCSEQVIDDRMRLEEPPRYDNGYSSQEFSGVPVEYSNPSDQDLGAHYEDPGYQQPLLANQEHGSGASSEPPKFYSICPSLL